jgi:hypothetical protein
MDVGGRTNQETESKDVRERLCQGRTVVEKCVRTAFEIAYGSIQASTIL